jgi:hypothetical protein
MRKAVLGVLCVVGCAGGKGEAKETGVPQAVRPVEVAPGAKKVAIEWLGEEGAEDDGPAVKPEALLAALPEEAQMEYDSALPGVEFWARLDAKLYLAQIRWGAFQSTVLVVGEGGNVMGKLDIDRRSPDVGIVDIVGDERKEVVIASIDGNGLSVYPTAWRFYRVSDAGDLELLATVAESHGYGPKCIRYFFRNQITTPVKGTIRVENIHFAEKGLEPPEASPEAAGEAYELRWNEKAGKLERTELPPGKTDPSKGGCDSPEGKTKREGPFDL